MQHKITANRHIINQKLDVRKFWLKKKLNVPLIACFLACYCTITNKVPKNIQHSNPLFKDKEIKSLLSS